MDTLADFIEALASEPYHLAGSYVSGDRPNSYARPIECDFEFSYNDEALFIEGRCKGFDSAQDAFRIKVDFETTTPHAAPVEVTTPRLRALQGRLLFFGGKVTFIGRVHAGALSAQITFERGGISIAGAFALDHHYYAFSLKGGPSSTYEVLSNVVGIRAPRRA